MMRLNEAIEKATAEINNAQMDMLRHGYIEGIKVMHGLIVREIKECQRTGESLDDLLRVIPTVEQMVDSLRSKP